MNRETTKLTTTSGKEVVVKTYLTARESNEIKRQMYDALKIDVSEAAIPGAKVIKDIPASFMLDRERKMLEQVVVSIDGSTDGVLDRLLDLPAPEYEELLGRIGTLIGGDFQPSK